MMNRLIPLVLSCAFALAIMNGCDELAEQAQTPLDIKLGVIGPFSGEHEEWGKSSFLGVEAVIRYHQEQNQKLQVELIKEDELYLAIQLLERACALDPRPDELIKIARLLQRNPLPSRRRVVSQGCVWTWWQAQTGQRYQTCLTVPSATASVCCMGLWQ